MITVYATGGTLDKQYVKDTLGFVGTHVPEMLAMGNVMQVRFEELMLVDSLDMTEDQRSAIVQACANTPEDLIVITHGTDTMCKTAKLLAKCKTIRHKTIVLTGAMIPFTCQYSDALFNLGMAFGAVQSKPPGIYIAIQSKVATWERVRKLNGKFHFESQEI